MATSDPENSSEEENVFSSRRKVVHEGGALFSFSATTQMVRSHEGHLDSKVEKNRERTARRRPLKQKTNDIMYN